GVLSISRWTIGIHWWSVPFQILLMGVLAAISYHYVERPLRTISWSQNRLVTLAYGGGAAALVSIIIVLLLKPLDGILYVGDKPDMVAIGVSSLAEPYYMSDAKYIWGGADCVLSGNDEVGKNISVENCT